MADVRLTIDDVSLVVPEGTNLIEAARSVGIRIPHFCYHPHLSRPANCRMCLVEIEGSPKLTPSCATAAQDGMVVRTRTPRAMDSHRSVMEFYLTNHPLDCPVCDQAGECVLQDYSYAFGPATSRFEDVKVTQPVKDVGPDIVLYADRCIMCTRCTRFLREVTNTNELVVTKRGVRNEIHVDPARPVDNPMAGNIVDICPVGALCSKDFLFKCRVWWLHSTASACPRCSRACSIRVDTNDGRIMRIKPMENPQVNATWICDQGRFAFQQWQGPGRLDTPLVRQGDGVGPATWPEALRRTADGLRAVIDRHGPGAVAFIGSPFATIEENRLLARLFASFGVTTAAVWEPPTGQAHEFTGFKISAEKAWNAAGARRAIADVVDNVLPVDRVADMVDAEQLRAVYALSGAYREATMEHDHLGFDRLELFAVQATFMCDLCLSAHVVLPGASPYEKTGTVRNEDGIEQAVAAAVDPPGQARRDWDILMMLAEAMAARPEGETPPEAPHAAHWDYTRGSSQNE